MAWIDCEKELPPQRVEGECTLSDRVTVELSDGRIAEDWLINGKWVIYCKNNGSSYPVRWKNGTYNN